MLKHIDPLNILCFVSETLCGLGSAFNIQGVCKSAPCSTRDKQLPGPSLISLIGHNSCMSRDFWTTSRKYYLSGVLLVFFLQISLLNFRPGCHFVSCPNSIL